MFTFLKKLRARSKVKKQLSVHDRSFYQELATQARANERYLEGLIKVHNGRVSGMRLKKDRENLKAYIARLEIRKQAEIVDAEHYEKLVAGMAV